MPTNKSSWSSKDQRLEVLVMSKQAKMLLVLNRNADWHYPVTPLTHKLYNIAVLHRYRVYPHTQHLTAASRLKAVGEVAHLVRAKPENTPCLLTYPHHVILSEAPHSVGTAGASSVSNIKAGSTSFNIWLNALNLKAIVTQANSTSPKVSAMSPKLQQGTLLSQVDSQQNKLIIRSPVKIAVAPTPF